MISKSRCGVILRIESISSDTMQEVDHLLCSGKRSSSVYPKRCEIAPTIKRLDSCSVLQARHILLEFFPTRDCNRSDNATSSAGRLVLA